jgi:hypothetical protein
MRACSRPRHSFVSSLFHVGNRCLCPCVASKAAVWPRRRDRVLVDTECLPLNESGCTRCVRVACCETGAAGEVINLLAPHNSQIDSLTKHSLHGALSSHSTPSFFFCTSKCNCRCTHSLHPNHALRSAREISLSSRLLELIHIDSSLHFHRVVCMVLDFHESIVCIHTLTALFTFTVWSAWFSISMRASCASMHPRIRPR